MPASPRPAVRPLPWPLHALESLKWRITLGTVLVVVLTALGVAAVLVWRAEADTLAAYREHERAEAARMATLLERRVDTLQQALQTAAGRIGPAHLADDAKLFAHLETLPVLRVMFSTLAVADAAGRVHALSDATGVRRPELSIADRDYFRRVLALGQPVISEPVQGRASQQPVVLLAHPLRHDGQVIGALVGSLHLADRALLVDMIDAGADGSQTLRVITDRAGRILAHPRRDRLLASLAQEPRLGAAWAQWVARAERPSELGTSIELPGEVVSMAGAAAAGWIVWRTAPEAELLAPLHRAGRHAAGWALAMVLAVLLVTITVVVTILRPLADLEQRAQRLLDTTQDPEQGWPVARGEIGSLAAVLRRVSAERARLEARSSGSLRRLRSVMAAAPVGIAFTHERRFVLVSEEMCRMFGRTEAQLLGQPAEVIYASIADAEAVGPAVVQALRAGHPYAGEWLLRRADGSTFWAQLRGRPVDAADHAAGIIWSILDISAEVSTRTQLEWSATHDALTGLANRKAYELKLEQVFQAKAAALPATLIAIDLDHFKPINDEAGHAAGDAVLKAVAAAITSCVRVHDLAVRVGGDEFAVLLEHCPHEVGVRLAESILQHIQRIALPWEQRALQVGASLGVASLSADTPDPQAWQAAADAACYAAKAAGRGTVRSAPQRTLRLVETDSGNARTRG